MHISAKDGIAITCRLSVCPSVCLSVTLVDCDHIGWNTSEIISPLVSLGCSLSADPNIMGLLQGEHPKFWLNRVPTLWLERNPGLFQDFPGPSWKIFQDLFGAHECLNIKKKHLLLTTFGLQSIAETVAWSKMWKAKGGKINQLLT